MGRAGCCHNVSTRARAGSGRQAGFRPPLAQGCYRGHMAHSGCHLLFIGVFQVSRY